MNETKWGDSLSSITQAIFIRRVVPDEDLLEVAIVTLHPDDRFSVLDYELVKITVVKYLTSLIRKIKEERGVHTVWVNKDTRDLVRKVK